MTSIPTSPKNNPYQYIEKTKLRKPTKKCCSSPIIKNEGRTVVNNVTNWEYHCYACTKTWTEFDVDNLKKS